MKNGFISVCMAPLVALAALASQEDTQAVIMQMLQADGVLAENEQAAHLKNFPHCLMEVFTLYQLREQPPAELVQRLLAAGADANERDRYGITPLICARKSAELTKLLLAAGASLQANPENGATPLHYASTPEVIDALLEAGADVNARCKLGDTPLHYAAAAGEASLCRKLIDCGAELNATDQQDATPLDCAVRDHKLQAARVLMEAGAEAKQYAPLYIAFLCGSRVDIEKQLSSGVDINAPLDELHPVSPLHLAVSQERLDICKLLIEKGADVNLEDDDGYTPLHYAVRTNQAAMCQLLIDAGAELEAQADEALYTPLAVAILFGKQKVIDTLLAAGANPNARVDARNLVPLLHSSLHSVDMVKKLLAAGADARARDARGKTALHSLRIGDEPVEVCRMLLAAGADVNARDVYVNTPLEESLSWSSPSIPLCRAFLEAGASVSVEAMKMAVKSELPEEFLMQMFEKMADIHQPGVCKQLASIFLSVGHVGMMDALVARGGLLKGWPALHRAALLGQVEEVERLLAAGASVRTRYKRRTPLLYAARMGRTAVCEKLLAAGADVNSADEDKGWTPLLAAGEAGHVELCRKLIAAGADIHARLGDATLLHLAVLQRNEELCRLMLAAGADVNAVGEEKETPLHMALKGNINEALVDMLLAAGANANATDQEGNAPLHYVLSLGSSYKLDTPVCRKLIEAGADVKLKNSKGESPEELSARTDYFSRFYFSSPRRSF